MRSDAGGAFLAGAPVPAAFEQGPRRQGGGKRPLSAAEGSRRRAPRLQAEVTELPEVNTKEARRRRPRKPPGVAKSDYTVYEMIRDRMGPLKEIAGKPGVPFDGHAKEAMGLEAILRQAEALASDLMSGTGFFEGRDPKLLPGVPLRYLHNGRSTAGMIFPEGKVPEYLAKFDDALHGISTETDEEKFKAVFVFMGKLLKAVRKAINGQASRAQREKRREEAAERMAEASGVGKGDYRTVVGEVVDKVLKLLKSDKAGLEAMRMTDQMNKVIPLQMVLRLAPEVGEDNLNWENFLGLILNPPYKDTGLPHFVVSRTVRFQKAIKRANKILYHRKMAEEKAGHAHAHAHKENEGRGHVEMGASSKPAAAAPSAAAKPAAGLAQRLVSLRYD
jgi:hypothetical protein